jgi:hypothetical protein
MKLRLRDSSVRLRLTRPEVQAVGRGERLEARTELPDGNVFRYAIVLAIGGPVTATFVDGCLEVVVPLAEGMPWVEGDAVSIESILPTAHGSCHLLIEKDFACLHPRAEDHGVETFPNPTPPRDRL